jgi:hypothetical protein
MGNISYNKCLRSLFSFVFIVALVCVAGPFVFIVLEWKRFVVKVLLGYTFARSIIVALGVELICSIRSVRVEDIYRNPSLGLATKARGCKVVGQKGSRESCHMLSGVQESMRE